MYAYLDENSELCFSLPQGVDSIKELAWHNAYELSTEQGNFIKKAYKKNGLKTFYLDKTLQKSNIDDAWSEQPEAERLEGDGQEFYTLAPSTLSFRSSAPLNEFKGVQIDGVTVDSSNYTLEEGSTVITFPIDYLKNFGKGDYEVAVESESKTVKGEFTVIDPETNDYGFYYNQPYSGYVSLFGEDEVFFIREGGIMDVIGAYSGTSSQATYTVSGKNMTIVSPIAGTLTGTISDDGMSIYCNELGVTFRITKDTVVADSNYLYIYKDEFSGYLVSYFNKTNSTPGAMKSSINNRDVVAIAPAGFNSSSIVSIVIPARIKYLGMGAFTDCNNLKSVFLSEGLTAIADLAFYNCIELENILIPASVNNIGDDAFHNCSKLKSIVIPNGVPQICSSTFNGCSSLSNIVISNSIWEIQGCAFQGCTSLTSIILPRSITSIWSYAFKDCSNLTNINFDGTIAQWNAIHKEEEWNENVPATYVQCTDGQVAL